MNYRRWLFLLALGTLALDGCGGRLFCRRDPPRGNMPPAGYTIPPTNIPDGPLAPPRGSGGGRGEILLPEDPPAGLKPRSNFEIDPLAPEPPKRGATLDAPRSPESPKILEGEPTPKPPEREQTKSDAPPGIEDFTLVKEGVNAGGRAEIAGLNWLKDKGYKTIVYLRRETDDDTTDRRQVEEMRKMKFVSLLVTPTTLNKQLGTEFSELINTKDNQPVFVYAREGAIAGSVWYLHFRTAEFLTHDEARVRAGRLGLKDEKSELFQGVVKMLEK